MDLIEVKIAAQKKAKSIIKQIRQMHDAEESQTNIIALALKEFYFELLQAQPDQSLVGVGLIADAVSEKEIDVNPIANPSWKEPTAKINAKRAPKNK